MKSIVAIIVFNLLFINISFSQGQVELNDIAHEEYYQSQNSKDSLVSELMILRSEDEDFKKTFELAEKHWNEFVDIQFVLKFPSFESWETRRQVYGSSFDMCYYQFLKTYCDLRITAIFDLFVSEGDVCGE